jgi:glycosyltransferase involved in cell wall biosynthesis
MQQTLAIVTICFNNKEDLVKTCLSVNTQTTAPFEHIIIDGSSNGEIKNYLETTPQPAWRKWICEKDNGIADAFNKGIKNTTGQIIHLLNSGDVYYNENILTDVLKAISTPSVAKWWHGKLHMKRGGIWVIIGKPFNKAKAYRGMRGTLHPTMFINRILYNTHGLFNTQLKIAMDYDFLLRIAEEPFDYLNFAIVTFDPGGVSSNTYLQSLKENKLCYEKYYGKSFKLIIWQWRLTLLHYLLHSKFGKLLYQLKTAMKLENY